MLTHSFRTSGSNPARIEEWIRRAWIVVAAALVRRSFPRWLDLSEQIGEVASGPALPTGHGDHVDSRRLIGELRKESVLI